MNRHALSAVRQLFRMGEASAEDLDGLEQLFERGVVVRSANGLRAVGTPRLVKLLRRLGPTEAQPAVFAVQPEMFHAWIRIVCARLEEQGLQRDASGLLDTIELLDKSSPIAVAEWSKRSLKPTAFPSLEREVFGSPAHEAVCTSKLLRVVAAAARVKFDRTDKAAGVLADVDSTDPSGNWIEGRLLLAPGQEPIQQPSSILSGSLENVDRLDLMAWVLARPWAFLMAQIVFLQEAWRAERVSGHLDLVLDRELVDNFHQPPQVRVVVTMPDGAEIHCGTFGELLKRILDELGVWLLTADVSSAVLDDMASSLIGLMLEREVWQFESGGKDSGYGIHPKFSDLCYRTLGSRYFYRKAGEITMSMRRVCELWAQERFARMGAVTELRDLAS